MNLFDLRSLFEYRSKLNEGTKTHIDIQSSECSSLGEKWFSGRKNSKYKDEEWQGVNGTGAEWGTEIKIREII